MRIGTRTLVAKTCYGCGELKMASEFRKAHGKWPQSDCRPCQHITAKQSDKRRNDQTQTTASNARSEWTEREVKALWELVDQGLTSREIGVKIGRSMTAVSQAKGRYPRR